MNIFETIRDYEQLVFVNDKDIGLKGIICIHNTILGPALGGCRLYNYKTEEDALFDVVRLAKGMTYKSAVAQTPWGGGKSVLIGDPKNINRELVFKAFGKFVESLNGRYITAEDVNTTTTDMGYVSESTNYVSGLAGKSGNPSWYTAKGVYYGIKAALKEKFRTEDLKGIRIALQGLGSVTMFLTEMLVSEGAIVIATDIDKEKCEEAKQKFNVTIVDPDSILSTDCDILSPGALGGIINEQTIDNIKAEIIAGCANNQLLHDSNANDLVQKGILYAPDFVVNAGGLISVTRDICNMTEEECLNKIAQIYDNTLKVFSIAKEKGYNTLEAANILAEDRLKNASKLDKIYSRRNKFIYKFSH